MSKQIRLLINTFIILVFINTSWCQVEYDWKEMASLDVYNYKGPEFWNEYVSIEDEVKSNILRAKKLGFNMVRIPLNFIDSNHGWPDPVNTGIVFTTVESKQYLTNLKEIIKFCNKQGMKTHLILFNNGYRNNAGLHNGNIYHNNYSELDEDKTILSYFERNAWFYDATAWIDHILTDLTTSALLDGIEVFELRNEAYPTSEIAKYSYPQYFHDVFLLEMTDYMRKHWPSIKIMISITQEDNVNRFSNLKAMLTRSANERYYRPSYMNYDESANTFIEPIYFDYFSFHNYNTYSFRKSFQDVLDIVGTLQTQPYDWFIGEIGFDLGTSGSYESDQAKYFQNDLQVINEFYNTMNSSNHNLKGVGIWSVFDYIYDNEPGVHYGIISSEFSQPKKRKAAYLIENYFEGLVDNPNFEVGPGDEPAFDDSPWCNGWTAWWEGIPNGYYNNYFEYSNKTIYGNHCVKIAGGSNKKLGWSSLNGGWIRVLPGTNIKVKAKVLLDDIPGSSSSIFIQLSYIDELGNWLGSSSTVNQVDKNNYSWQTISLEEKNIPNNAAFAAPYLMSWNSNSDVYFDDIEFYPEARPLITFTFDSDITYFPPGSGGTLNPLMGWSAYVNDAQVTNNIFKLDVYTNVRTTHYINNNQIVSIRAQKNREYAVSAYVKSPNAKLKLNTHKTYVNDYPDGLSQEISCDITGNIWNSENLYWLNSNSDNWINIQYGESISSSGTEARSFTVFEKDVNYISYKVPKLEKSIGIIENTKPSLHYNFPNPFNSITTIFYSTKKPGFVSIKIYDVLGRQLKILVNKFQNPNDYSIKFDASEFPSGVYFYKINVGNDFSDTKKLLHLK